jgi:hypothetical protein
MSNSLFAIDSQKRGGFPSPEIAYADEIGKYSGSSRAHLAKLLHAKNVNRIISSIETSQSTDA